MLFKIFLCLFMCFFIVEIYAAASEELDFDYDDSHESSIEELTNKQELFRHIKDMINEARAIVLGILKGELSDEIKTEIAKQGINPSGSYDGVYKLVRICLKKAKNKEEGEELVKKCFERAIRERQKEEATEEQPNAQGCIQDAMLEASQAAVPLLMEAQEYGALFREMVQKTGSGLANCREYEKPFHCMVTVWGDAQQNMTFMRDQIIDMMLIARNIYIQYTDNVRKCLTPVEGIDGEEAEPEFLEGFLEEETKKDPTPNALKSTPAYYDPIEETRNKFFPVLKP